MLCLPILILADSHGTLQGEKKQPIVYVAQHLKNESEQIFLE